MPPKIKIMITGDSNINFASGARSTDRRLATVTAEACSERPVNRLSRSGTRCFPKDIDGAVALLSAAVVDGMAAFERDEGAAALKCPVYRRIVVRYDRLRLPAPISVRPRVPSSPGPRLF